MDQFQQTLIPSQGRSESDKARIKDQLKRLMQSPYFKNSKRYPVLLRYVVEKAMEGDVEELKERLIGNAVFQKSADYDTNDDNVVRVTAGEIRKRLALYYQQPEHSLELRIDLPAGSYIPTFQLEATEAQPPALADFADDSKTMPDLAVRLEPPVEVARARAPWVYVALTLLCAIPLALLASHWATRRDEGSVESLWTRVIAPDSSLLFCLPVGAGVTRSPFIVSDSGQPATQVRSPKESDEHNSVPLADVGALVQIASAARTRGKAHWVKGERFTTIKDLRAGPVVLIGAWDNEWTMRLIRSLRYEFEADNASKTYRIRDKQNPNLQDWSLSMEPGEKVTRDYAVVACFHDSLIDQPVVIAAGLTMYGTMAASEVLSNSKYLDGLLSQAPKGWKGMNFEAVLAVDVVSGNYGTPRVVASTFW